MYMYIYLLLAGYENNNKLSPPPTPPHLDSNSDDQMKEQLTASEAE